MPITWTITADEHRARIFESRNRLNDFHEIEDFISPEARLQEQDLARDAKGRYFSNGERMAGHTGEPAVSKLQHQQELFAKQIGDYLNKARMENRYDQLRLIAFSKFLGLLRKNLSNEVQKLVADEVSKDISGLDARSIKEYIKTRL